VTALDWVVLFATLGVFVAYGLWRGRGTRDLGGYLLANRELRGITVLLSVMATQASAITFLSTPGQGFADGLRFVQFYFGLPFAMVVLCLTVVPAYHRMRVFTAYEYLEHRFDRRTRLLTAALFLVQRGLAVGLTIYAPALVLSVLLGWELPWTCALLGALAVAYTAWGGSKAVGHAHALQFLVILGAMGLAFALIVRALPQGVGLGDATALAGRLGRLNPIQTHFDLDDRYNLWSGLIGGFFLQLSYSAPTSRRWDATLADTRCARAGSPCWPTGCSRCPCSSASSSSARCWRCSTCSRRRRSSSTRSSPRGLRAVRTPPSGVRSRHATARPMRVPPWPHGPS
jgi:Na+/proline symporter